MAKWLNTEWNYSLPRDMISADELSGRIKACRDLKLSELRIPLMKKEPQRETPRLIFDTNPPSMVLPLYSPPLRVVFGGKAAMMLAFGNETPSVRDWLSE